MLFETLTLNPLSQFGRGDYRGEGHLNDKRKAFRLKLKLTVFYLIVPDNIFTTIYMNLTTLGNAESIL